MTPEAAINRAVAIVAGDGAPDLRRLAPSNQRQVIYLILSSVGIPRSVSQEALYSWAESGDTFYLGDAGPSPKLLLSYAEACTPAIFWHDVQRRRNKLENAPWFGGFNFTGDV